MTDRLQRSAGHMPLEGSDNPYYCGFYETDASTAVAEKIFLSFVPRKIRLINLTDGIEIEWFDGMPDLNTWRRAATGVPTYTVGSGFAKENLNFTVAAADMPASKSFVVECIG